MWVGRIAAISTGLAVLAGGVAGCADTLAGVPTAGPTASSPGASTTSSAPATTTTRAGRQRPRELDLRGLDACSTLTEQQRTQFGLDGTPQSYDQEMLGRACTIRNRQRNMGAAVVLATRMGLAEWDEMTPGLRGRDRGHLRRRPQSRPGGDRGGTAQTSLVTRALDVQVTLSTLAFDVLWAHLELPGMPLVIKVPSPGTTHAERRELECRAWEELAERRLGGPHRLHGELERMLAVLAHADREIDARIWVGASLRVLAAASGRHAAMAALAGGSISLQPASAEGLARAATSVLPAAPAGGGRSVTLPACHLEGAAAEAGADTVAFEQALRARGVRMEDARLLVRMTRGVLARGQFGAAASDATGRRHRASTVVGFHDTSAGRYLQIRRVASDGQPWSTITPADRSHLIAQVDRLLASIP